jgi:hypothetical protein
MRPPSEYIAPFDEDRQTGLVQRVPAGRVVAVGVGVRVGVGVVGDADGLADAVADWDVEAELDDEAEAEWVAELDDEADAGVEAVLEVDADGGFVAVAGADPLVVLAVGAGVTLSLSMVKAPRRLEVVPSRQVKTALIVCDPSTNFVVSYGRAVPSLAVPARSNGGTLSVRTGALLCRQSSR